MLKLTMSITKKLKENTTEYFLRFLEENYPESVKAWIDKDNLLEFDKCWSIKFKKVNEKTTKKEIISTLFGEKEVDTDTETDTDIE